MSEIIERRAFGRYLRERREAAGLTQGDVGAAVGASQPTVSTWERGESWPNGGHARGLSQALGVSLEQLLSEWYGLVDDVERAIVGSDRITLKEQDALLVAYGALAGRDSMTVASLLRAQNAAQGQ
jgi:transcriptional regulator with XRE-family HTH domain